MVYIIDNSRQNFSQFKDELTVTQGDSNTIRIKELKTLGVIDATSLNGTIKSTSI